MKITRRLWLKPNTDNLDHNASWEVNDVKQKDSVVRPLIASFNIHMENKCMFLPQELIPDFVNLKPKDVRAYYHRHEGVLGRGTSVW